MLVVGGVRVDALSVINYLYGFIGLFVVVAGTHGIAHFLTLTTRVTNLPVAEADTAAERLESVAGCSVFVATTTFVGVLLLLIVYGRLVTVADGDTMELAAFVTEYAFFVLLILSRLILVGMVVFWVPRW